MPGGARPTRRHAGGRAAGTALEQARVYLLSGLDESLVEDVGLVPLAGGADLARLAAQHTSCIVLANAQYAISTPENEDDLPPPMGSIIDLALEDARDELE